jgi:hypothetical protein
MAAVAQPDRRFICDIDMHNIAPHTVFSPTLTYCDSMALPLKLRLCIIISTKS